MLLQVSRIIFSMFSGMIIVTVNIEFEGEIKVISFQKHSIYFFRIKIFQKT